MSRGLGPLQHRICNVLHDAEDQQLPLRELRRRLGEPDRSNLRRAIRGLLEREIIEESNSGGEPHVALTVWGYIGTSIRLDSPRDSSTSIIAGDREDERVVVREGPDAVRRRPKVGATRRPAWVRYEHRFVRNRPLGEQQRRILRVLQESIDPRERGLPVTVVKEMVGADRSNARRAIRTLLLRGLLEESADGRRIRLSLQGALVGSLQPRSASGEPGDDRRAGDLRSTLDATGCIAARRSSGSPHPGYRSPRGSLPGQSEP